MNKFAKFAALAESLAMAMQPPDHAHLPEELLGGRLPQPRGPNIYGTYSRYNGTFTATSGTNTAYY
jgi:hypothetical protein